MARPPRIYLPGVPVHVVQRGNDRASMFAEMADYECFRNCAIIATRRFGVAVHAYVLMTNHVHMLATPGRPDSLSRAMHWLGTVFVQDVNIRHKRSGSRIEGRYKCRFIQDDAHFLACMRYIESNPVRAAMVETPESYRWSSYHSNARGQFDPLVSPHKIFSRLGAGPDECRTAYRNLFATAISPTELEELRMPTRARGRPAKGARSCNGV
jgi:putative transposase